MCLHHGTVDSDFPLCYGIQCLLDSWPYMPDGNSPLLQCFPRPWSSTVNWWRPRWGWLLFMSIDLPFCTLFCCDVGAQTICIVMTLNKPLNFVSTLQHSTYCDQLFVFNQRSCSHYVIFSCLVLQCICWCLCCPVVFQSTTYKIQNSMFLWSMATQGIDQSI